jgi:hypothetical protein
MSGSGCPVDHGPPPQSECPVKHSDDLNLSNMMDKDLHKQKPSPGQTKELSTERMKSSIPKADPEQVWEYPSPQMVCCDFFFFFFFLLFAL